MRKLSAFTLIEMIVTLLITIIIVFLSMQLFSSFGTIYNRSLSRDAKSLQLLLVYSMLKDNMHNADSVKGNDNVIIAFAKERVVFYEFRANGIFVADSNHVVLDSLVVELVEYNPVYIAGNNIERLEFSFNMNGIPHNVILSREYEGKRKYNINRYWYGD